MIVEDITPQQTRPKHRESGESQKVVLKEFSSENAVALAVLGKRIYRLYTSIDNMFPVDETTFYQHLFDHIASMKDDTSYGDALKRVGQSKLRRRLLTFVSFLSSANSYLITLLADELRCFFSTP